MADVKNELIFGLCSVMMTATQDQNGDAAILIRKFQLTRLNLLAYQMSQHSADVLFGTYTTLNQSMNTKMNTKLFQIRPGHFVSPGCG